MKKSIFFAALVLLSAASCTRKAQPEIPVADDCVLSVGASDFTKTSVSKEGEVFKTYWTNGDCIVVNGYISRPLELASESAVAQFHVDNYNPGKGDLLNILYVGSKIDYASDSFRVPAIQLYSDGKYPGNAAPMWASSNYPDDVTMHNLCAVLSFTFHNAKNSSITGISLRAVANEAIAGDFSMGYAQGRFNGNFVAGGSNSAEIRINFDKAVVLPAGTSVSINVPVLGAEYARGFSAKVYSGDKYAQYNFFSAGKSVLPTKAYLFKDTEFNPDNAVYELEDYSENILFDTQLFTAGTYNILAADGRSSCPNNTWAASKATIASIIMNMDCDIMTLNELSDTEVNDLKKMLTGYSWVTNKNSYHNGTFLKYYEMSYCPGIIYKASRFEKLEDGIFWLCNPDTDHLITDNKTGRYSYTDPKDGKEYAAGQSRCCVWAKFKDTVTDRQFYWFAPHPHIRGDDSASSLAATTKCLNAGNVRSLLKQIPYVNKEGLPYLIVGDMNTHPTHVTYKEVFKPAGLVNAMEQALEYDVLDATTALKPGTSPGYMPADYSYGAARRIDHLWLSGFQTKAYKNIFTMYNNASDGQRYPSDHLPILTVLSYE